ncbi:hypothetical protein WEH80_32035 [Actinomycetes bacterium KLBMP 9759]
MDSLWTRPLQVLVAACSAVFVLGTAAQAFLVIGPDMVEHAMRLSGRSAQQAVAEAPALVTTLRTVGVCYLVGNALGLLALTGRTWTFWCALAVNASQAAGVVAGMVPWVVLRASVDLYGPLGAAPTIVTDGGAALLALTMIGFLLRRRVLKGAAQ